MTVVLSHRRVVLIAAGAPLWLDVRGAEAAEGGAGPFGLTWGLSSDEVRKTGIALTPAQGPATYGTSFSATDLPRSLSDMETALLAFGYDDRLWRVAAIGRTVGPDPGGYALVARYQDLAASLTGRYGQGRETDMRDREMWKGPNEYIMSLHMGRARRFTTFDTDAVHVELSIRASASDNGYYVLIYGDRAGAIRFDQQKKAREKEAL